MLIEGPIITSIAAFAASIGYFNVYIILLLSSLGNIIPDCILFFIGRFGRKKPVEKFVEKFRVNSSILKKIEYNMHKYTGKTLVFVKFSPFLPVPGIILAGFMKTPIKRFLILDITINVITAAIFTIIGFYFGLAVKNIFDYLKIGEYVILLIVPLIFTMYYISRKLLRKIWNSN